MQTVTGRHFVKHTTVRASALILHVSGTVLEVGTSFFRQTDDGSGKHCLTWHSKILQLFNRVQNFSKPHDLSVGAVILEETTPIIAVSDLRHSKRINESEPRSQNNDPYIIIHMLCTHPFVCSVQSQKALCVAV